MKHSIALLFIFLVGCGGSPVARPAAKQANQWNIQGNSMPEALAPAPGSLGQFSFPSTVGYVGYVTSSYSGTRPASITMVYRIDGDGVFDADWQGIPGPCYNAPSVTVMAEVRGDDMQNQDGRWWAGTQVLEDNSGLVTVSIPVDLAQWTNVQGQPGTSRMDGFNHAFENLGHVGFTFGGCSNYGHGVRLSAGASTFTLESYEVR